METAKRRGAFISYSRSDRYFALDFAKELRSAGYPIWLDQLDIPTGARWDDEVEKALSECEIFLIVLTPASVASENVKDEIGYAIDHGKRIMPVLLKECTIPLRLRRFQYVNFTEMEFSEGITRAKQLLGTLLNTQHTLKFSTLPRLSSQKQPDHEEKPSPFVTKNKPIQRKRLSVGTRILVFGICLGALLSGPVILEWMRNKPAATSQTLVPFVTVTPSSTLSSTSVPTTLPPLATSPSLPVQLPDSPTVTMIDSSGNKIQYTILSAEREPLSPGRYLLHLRVRAWTDAGQGMGLWSDSFRLVIGDQRLAPVNYLNELVDRDETVDGDVNFEIDSSLTEAILKIQTYSNSEPTQLRLIFP